MCVKVTVLDPPGGPLDTYVIVVKAILNTTDADNYKYCTCKVVLAVPGRAMMACC